MKVALADLGRILTGNTPKKSDEKNYLSNDIYFIKPSDFVNDRITQLYDAEHFISHHAESSARVVPSGSVLVTCIGIIGKVAITKKKMAFNQQINAIIPVKNIVNEKFLAYALLNKQRILQEKANAPVVPIINKGDFSKLTIDIYELEKQRKICDRLEYLENIIKYRQEQLNLLDELVKSRFVEMFGSVKTNSMNWPIVEIGNIIEKLEAGWSGSGQQRDKKSGEIAVLKVSSVTQGYFIPEECKVLDNQKNIKKYIFPQKGDLLFSRANTREMVGATAIIMMDYPELILPDKLWKIQFKDNANVFYMKQVLSSTCIRKRFSAVSTGTSGSMYNVSMDKFKKIDIPLPPVNLQEKFAEFIIDIHKSRLLFKCQLLQYHNIEHIIRGRNYG